MAKRKSTSTKSLQKSLISFLLVLVIFAAGWLWTNVVNKKPAVQLAASSYLQSGLSTTVKQAPLDYTGSKQLILTEQDSLGRAVDAHIQLKNSQEPRKTREALDYDPVGWHNYNFYYKTGTGSTRKAWLMSRGHLVGYQFSGLNNDGRNLVPEPAWFNAGNYTGMDDSNTQSMLYYENRLDSWLANHPHYYLDYQVTPLYKGNELLPRQIRLAYVGIDNSGQTLQIRLGGGREASGNGASTVVYLDNKSPNADINYASGTATNTVNKQ
ncbi:DNA/RNA non-specific endonuclease [Lactovum odontotermitis]